MSEIASTIVMSDREHADSRSNSEDESADDIESEGDAEMIAQMAKTFIQDTEEDKAKSEPIAKVLANGNMKIQGTSTLLKPVNGADIVNLLVDAVKESGDDTTANVLVELAQQHADEANFEALYVRVEDLLSLTKPVKKKSEKSKPEKKSALLNAVSTRDYRTGTDGPNKSGARGYLAVCEANLFTVEEFKRKKKGKEMSVDFDKANRKIKEAEGKKGDLSVLGKKYLTTMDASDIESKKACYLFGRGNYTSLPRPTFSYIMPGSPLVLFVN